MRLGFTDVHRYTPGIANWSAERHFQEVSGHAAVSEKLSLGVEAVDDRTVAEYDAGHLPGARHIDQVGQIDVSTPIVLYGAGGPDGDLVETAISLEDSGYAVFLYSGGYADWVDGGNPVE
ncbi:MAG: rhodanese-like domain-containing protein [Planctomycetota bacterium]